MKNRKWIPVSVITLVVVVTALIVLRHQIINSLLQAAIETKTSGKVILETEKLYMDVTTWNIIITKPSLKFRNINLSNSDTLLLQQIDFDKLVIKGLSFSRLFFHKDFACSYLLMDKPDVKLKKLSSGNEYGNKRHFDPFILIKILKNKSFGQTDLVLDILRTEIRFGKVNLLQAKLKNSSGSATYTINIDKLKTTGRKSIDRNELTYQNLSAGIGNLKYTLNGYKITLDTSVYRSENKHFDILGLSIQQNEKNHRHGLQSFKGDIALQGIILDDTSVLNSKGLNLSSIQIGNGQLSILTGTKSNKPGYKHQALNLFFSIFPSFSVDTISIGNYNVTIFKEPGKKTAAINNLYIRANRFSMDSTVIDKGIRAVRWKNLKAEFQSLNINSGDKIFTAGKTVYNERKKRLTVSNTSFLNSNNNNSFKCIETRIENLLVKPLLLKKQQEINIRLENPVANLYFEKKQQKLSGKNLLEDFKSYFKPEKTVFVHGELSFSNTKGLTGMAHNLNLSLTGPDLKKLTDSLPQLKYDELRVELTALQLNDTANSLTLHGSNIYLDSAGLQFDSIFFSKKREKNSVTLNAGKTSLNGLLLNPLIFKQKLIVNELLTNRPRLTIIVHKNKKPAQRNPFYYFIGKLHAVNGAVSFTLTNAEDTISFSSTVEAEASHLLHNNNLIETWLNTTGKKITLKNSHLKKSQSSFKAGNIKYTDTDSSLYAKRIYIKTNYKGQRFKCNLTSVTLKHLITGKPGRTRLHWQKALVYGDSLIITQTDTLNNSNGILSRSSPGIIIDTTIINLNNVCKASAKDEWVIDNLQAAYFQKNGNDSSSAQSIFNHTDFQIENLSYLMKNSPVFLSSKAVFYSRDDKILSAESIYYSGEFHNNSKQTTTPFKVTGINAKVYRPALSKNNDTFASDSITLSRATLHMNNSFSGSDSSLRKIATTSGNKTKQFKINTFNCKDFNIIIPDADSTKEILTHTFISADTLLWTPETSSVRRPYYFNRFFVDLNGKAIVSDDSLYNMGIRSFTFSLPEHKLTIDTLFVMPRYNEKIFFQKAGFQTDRVYFVADKTVINRIDLDSFLNQGIFKAESILSFSPEINITRDKHYPLNPKLVKMMPVEWLRSLPVPFYFDTIAADNANITYSEYSEKSSAPGIVKFTGTNAGFSTVTNIPGLLSPAGALKMNVQSKLMGKADFSINITMPYNNNPEQNFWMEAKSNDIDLTTLNPVTQNLMGITIKSGKGNVVVPFASGNDTLIKGRMIFKYKKLKFRLYDRDKATAYKGIAAPFVNFMLNNIMIRPNNPRLLGKTETGIIWFERDRRKSFVNFIWKGILSGALSTMGFNTKNQRLEKKDIRKKDKRNNKK